MIIKYSNCQTSVLGCTHYPLIKDRIKRVLGDVNFFDGSIGVSKELVRQLKLRSIKFCSDDKLSIEFVDSSNDVSKGLRFRNLMNGVGN